MILPSDCPSSRVSEVIAAPYDDVDALRQLADCCDVLTYEFENVDADGLDAVIKDGQLPQGTELLRISQNRIFEKDFLSNKAQVTVAPYKVVTSSLDLEDIDLSKKLRPQDCDRWLRWPRSKSHHISRRFGRGKCTC